MSTVNESLHVHFGSFASLPMVWAVLTSNPMKVEHVVIELYIYTRLSNQD